MFTASCAPVVEMLGNVQGLLFQASVAIAATELGMARYHRKGFKLQLLETTKRYHDQLTAVAKEHTSTNKPLALPTPEDPKSWIEYSTVVEKNSAKEKDSANGAGPEGITCLPRIIVHSEEAVQLCQRPQDKYEVEKKTNLVPKWIPIPWTAWLHSALAQDMDAVAADTSVVLQILRSLHVDEALQSMPLEICHMEGNDKATCAKVTKDIDAEELALPPCVLKRSRCMLRPSMPIGYP